MASAQEQVPTGVLASQISRAIVQIWHEYTGRGPTKARTTITDELVIVLMADTLLKAEKNLATDGKVDQVLSMRRAFQDTMQADLTAVVEDLTGRKVMAFMSHNHVDPDLAAELFVLEPRVSAARGPVVAPA
ncbi:MAG: hypothetical protein QOD61_1079 [Solirubrobacteraceae bacterium]|nr:hypothetical protein [Solirubrobacteraceae bacterium]